MFFTDQYIIGFMLKTLKNFGGKKLGGLILIIVIIIAFGFGGFGGGFSTNNQNNIAKINKTNVTTQDFMDYVNQSGISLDAIRTNLDNNIIEELLSGLISTTLIDLEVKDFALSISERTILKTIIAKAARMRKHGLPKGSKTCPKPIWLQYVLHEF